MDAFLPKPVQMQVLVSLLDAVAQTVVSAHQRQLHDCGTGHGRDERDLESCGGELSLEVIAELEAIGGRPGFVDGLLQGYLEDNQRLLERLAQSLAQRKPGECREVLHAIKGSAVSIGAWRMKDCCERMELMLSEHMFNTADELMDALGEAFNALRQQILRYQQGKPVQHLNEYWHN